VKQQRNEGQAASKDPRPCHSPSPLLGWEESGLEEEARPVRTRKVGVLVPSAASRLSAATSSHALEVERFPTQDPAAVRRHFGRPGARAEEEEEEVDMGDKGDKGDDGEGTRDSGRSEQATPASDCDERGAVAVLSSETLESVEGYVDWAPLPLTQGSLVQENTRSILSAAACV